MRSSPGPATLLALSLLWAGALGPAARAEGWKSCTYNDQPIGCRDSQQGDGSVMIRWRDGKAMTYRLVQEGYPTSVLRDSLGGIWERELYPQGNVVYTNPDNGNRIFVPLRY
ncbi:hypothetical protein EVJ50_10940 [Synechococcus sp. RSCCF101]|uniref:hypothetical protein n=1 Tax=Synechococcus sp. RSCCF101 TaxID=2511069 RepID=UPI0012477BBF|nr:hypothetical protein [Synechococcus sp. RSCCF101]QEY32660.1 hypothetical protein EVJ50_10940 [Synechococcus sp. RSCCF101]